MNQYKALTEQEVVQYVKAIDGLFAPGANLVSREIGDGNLNLVFRIEDTISGVSVIVKQALDYVRCVGDDWPLTRGRVKFESEAMQIQDKLTDGLVPKIYKYDDVMAIMVMEDLKDYKIMRKGLMQMEKYPFFAEQISTFLAKTLFYTSDLYMDAGEKKALVKEFINPELCAITESLVFTDPYFDASSNNINPELRPYLENEFWKNDNLRREVTILKESFMCKAQALVHGDLHTGSIFINEQEMRAFDAEFAYYGPAGFDIGAVIGNLILNYASWTGKDLDAALIEDYRAYLLETIKDIWDKFVAKFTEYWDKDGSEGFKNIPGYQEYYMQSLLQDTLGFGGCKTMRRCIGLAHVADIDSIEDLNRRAQAQIFALKIGQAMVLERQNISSIDEFIDIVQKLTAEAV